MSLSKPAAVIVSVPSKRLFAVAAAARYLGCCDDTIRRYADLSVLPVYRNPSGHRVFKVEDLDKLVNDLPLWNAPGRETPAGREEESQ